MAQKVRIFITEGIVVEQKMLLEQHIALRNLMRKRIRSLRSLLSESGLKSDDPVLYECYESAAGFLARFPTFESRRGYIEFLQAHLRHQQSSVELAMPIVDTVLNLLPSPPGNYSI